MIYSTLKLALVPIMLTVASSAFSGSVVIVNPKNQVSALALDQAARLFLAQISSFPDGSMAKPVNLPEGNALRDEFYVKTSQKNADQLKSYWARLMFTGRGMPPKELA